MLNFWQPTFDQIHGFLDQGGPAMWVLAGLSVVTLTLILWKIWRLLILGGWAGQRAHQAVGLWIRGDGVASRELVAKGGGVRARVVRTALASLSDKHLSEVHAREETERVAQIELTRLRTGLRALELIATIAPLIGLLGTVLGMINAFQALQDAGSRADPATLAGGIWEALLTTAIGMAVAIPASAALTWFESIADRVQGDMEDLATQIFTRSQIVVSLASGKQSPVPHPTVAE